MATGLNNKREVKVTIDDSVLICTDFNVSQDKNATTISMTLSNSGTSHVLLSLNNFCLVNGKEAYYAQQCYISDGQQFEVISGWKSFSENKSYTIIIKYALNPILTNYELYYKTATQQYLITKLN